MLNQHFWLPFGIIWKIWKIRIKTLLKSTLKVNHSVFVFDFFAFDNINKNLSYHKLYHPVTCYNMKTLNFFERLLDIRTIKNSLNSTLRL